MSTALLLLPDFALILLGFAIRRWMQLGDHFWSGLEKLVYFVLFPALLVNAIVKTQLDLGAAAPLLIVALSAMAGGMLLGYLIRYFFPLRPLVFASIYQCGYRFNSYIGLAVAGLLYGSPGIATMGLIVGVAVPFANLASVWMLARHGEARIWREIARNPLIWATAAGLLLNLAGFVPPRPLQLFLGRLADASIALGLLAVGAALRFNGRAVAGVRGASWYLLLVKLVAVPGIAAALGWQLGLAGLNYGVVVLFAALPTASSAYILAMRMGGDGQSVAWLISATTLGSMLTLPLWAAWIAGCVG
jgi:predicted permease